MTSERQPNVIQDGLDDRRRWFAHFPDGSIEFVMVTRAFAVLLLLALGIVSGVQRPVVITSLVGMLWVEYALIAWWLVQIATDLDALTQPGPTDAKSLRERRVKAAILAVVPSAAAGLAITPWWGMLAYIDVRISSPVIIQIVALAVCLAAAAPAVLALRRVGLGPSLWTALMLVPILHWLAVHRLMKALHVRIDAAERAADDAPARGVGLLLADVTWLLGVAPWMILWVTVLAGRDWPSGMPGGLAPMCGTILATVFAVADLAAMESLQAAFLRVLRRGAQDGQPRRQR